MESDMFSEDRLALLDSIFDKIFNNKSKLYEGAIVSICDAATIIQKKLRQDKNSLMSDEEKKTIDEKSSKTKRNSQYKTKARTIIFHITNVLQYNNLSYLDIEYKDLSLPRYDDVSTQNIKMLRNIGGNAVIYENLKRLKGGVKDDAMRKSNKKRHFGMSSVDGPTEANFYWELNQANFIEKFYFKMITMFYGKYESAALKLKSEKETIKLKKSSNHYSGDKNRGDVIVKLMLAIIAEFPYDSTLEFLNIKSRDQISAYALKECVLHLMDVLYPTPTSIAAAHPKLKCKLNLIDKKYWEVISSLYVHAQNVKYKYFYETTLTDDNNAEPLDITQFPILGKCTNDIYCFESDTKLDLKQNRRMLNPQVENPNKKVTYCVDYVQDACTHIFDVVGFGGENDNFQEIMKTSWYERLDRLEKMEEYNSNFAPTIKKKLKRITRLQILYDNFTVSKNSYIYIRTKAIGLGSLFCKESSKSENNRQRTAKRHKKTISNDLSLRQLYKDPSGKLSSLENDVNDVEYYQPREYEPNMEVNGTIYTKISGLNDLFKSQKSDTEPVLFNEAIKEDDKNEEQAFEQFKKYMHSFGQVI